MIVIIPVIKSQKALMNNIMAMLNISGRFCRFAPAASIKNMLISIMMIPGMISPVFRNRPPWRLNRISQINAARMIRCMTRSTQNTGAKFSGMAAGIVSLMRNGISQMVKDNITRITRPAAI